MNEKTKKTLKKVGIIAGCVVGGVGLMYAGYLAGTGFLKIPGIKTIVGVDKSTIPGQAFDLCIKKSFLPGNKCVAYPFNKDEAIEAVKTINGLIQEVV